MKLNSVETRPVITTKQNDPRMEALLDWFVEYFPILLAEPDDSHPDVSGMPSKAIKERLESNSVEKQIASKQHD